MGHLWSISVLALSLTASGCVLLFDDGGETSDPPVLPTQEVESARFAPSLCVGGMPGTSQCQINQVPLDDLGAKGTFEFVVQPGSSGFFFDRLVLSAGSTGLHVVRPSLRAWIDTSLLSEVVIDATLDIPPRMSAPLSEGMVLLPLVRGVTGISIRFEAFRPFVPE